MASTAPTTTTAGTGALSQFMRYGDILLAVAMAMIVAMMIVPLPEPVLDLLIILNLAMALTIFFISMYITEPLQFSAFPSLLLIATLFRLALNVSASRLVLLQGHAGSVIEAFGNFVIGGNYVVGVVIFLILIIIQFVVITNGAGRVAEVAARFTLDAMPGKQMSIDADLNSGSIDEATARQRRRNVEQEANFYGAMDGASKFVKGDAIAGVIIMLVNILGGITIGAFQLGMPIAQALQTYTLLTVGDGLVSQIPALLISTATGLIVTRAASDTNLARDLGTQLFSNPRILFTVASLLAGLALVPGLPKPPLFLLAGALAGAGYLLRRQSSAQVANAIALPQLGPVEAAEPEDVHVLLRVDPLEIQVGYAVIPVTDAREGGTLLGRITLIRRQMALELGIVIPPIHIHDNMQLPPNQYSIRLRGSQVATGEVRANRLMAMNPGTVDEEIEGIPGIEPAFGLPAVWILPVEQQRAEMLGYTVVDPASVIITHLSEVIRSFAPSILSRQDVQTLLGYVKDENPTLVAELVPDLLTHGEVQRVLQALLRERVSVRDLVTILESAADHARTTRDPDQLAETARQALARQITGQYQTDQGHLLVMALAPALQQELARVLVQTERGPGFHLDTAALQRLLQGIRDGMEQMAAGGDQPILLCPARLRLALRRLTESSLPSLVVLSYNEVASGTDLITVHSVEEVSPVGAAQW